MKPHSCKESNISIDFLNGTKDTLKVNLTINKSSLGKIDLMNNNALRSAYKEFCDKFSNNTEYFKSEIQFKDVMRMIVDKLRNQDFELEGKKIIIELNDNIKSFLGHPTIMNNIDDVIRISSRKGFVREWSNLMIAYLTVLSTKTDNPINLDFTGATSVGKSYIVVRATIAFDKSFLDVLIGGSKTSYKYMGKMEDDGKYHVHLEGMSIILLETSESQDLIRFFKAIMSHDTENNEFEMTVTGKNEITGESESRRIVIHGIPSFILLGTVTLDEDEYLSRTLRGAPEISSGKTKESVSIGFQKWSKPIKHVKHPDLQFLKDSMSYLKKYPTFNIFAPIIDEFFPKDDMTRNRDRDKLIGLIESITILHQLQRKKYDDFLAVTLEDNIIGLMLMDKMIDTTFASLPKTTLEIYKIMKQMEEPENGGKVIPLEESLILEQIDVRGNVSIKSLVSLKEQIKRLLNHHLIEVKVRGHGSQPRSYMIVPKEDLYRLKLTPLFIEKVAKKLDKILEDNEDLLLQCSGDGDIMSDIIEMNYFRPENVNTAIYYITPENLRAQLFDKQHVLDIVGDENTKEYLRRKINREKEKRMIMSGRKYIDSFIPDENSIDEEGEEDEEIEEEEMYQESS